MSEEKPMKYPISECVPGTADLRFEYVRTKEQMAELEEFAKTFNHKIPTLKFAYVMIRHGEKRELVGYAQLVNVPIVFPALHPGKTTPRMVTDIMKHFIGQAKLNLATQQEGLVGVPLDSETFTRDIMLRMGFIDINNRLYAVGGD